LLLVVSAGLMIGAMRQESATDDEAIILGAGYSYWHGYRYRLYPVQPPLAQLLAAFPLTILDANISPQGRAFLDGRLMADPLRPWDPSVGGIPLRRDELFPHGPNFYGPGFYHFSYYEEFPFGGDFIYGGQNDGEKLLFWGRIPEVLLTLLTGVIVFLWARQVQGDAAGLLAAAMLLFNPVMLSYGHIVQTDIGIALAFPLAVWMFARLLETPTIGRAVIAGLGTALALATKYTAVILGPTFAVLWLLHRWRRRSARHAGWKHILVVAVVAWGMILLLYAPHWTPAPPLNAPMAGRLGVPSWFLTFRPVLIPAEYFKGLTIMMLHALGGGAAYLNGVWSQSGWWYYFPLAFAMKTPLPFLLFASAGIVLAVRSHRELHFIELAAWAGAAMYLLCAMRSKADIGVRHILAVYPLLSVGAACALGRWMQHIAHERQNRAHWAVVALPTASLAVAALAYPFFICYMNPLVGGTEHGYEHLLDSNYDWGQDVIHLKQVLTERSIKRIYLQYFGTPEVINYYGIANDLVTSEDAKQIQQGWLVVSVHRLMRPEWRWLRESQRPVARVGYTLFVYRIGNPPESAPLDK
jgi:4-amino-4-deoxy-L-arabinose transferase-like glycosyltransferase